MKARSLAVDLVAALTCLGGSWSCGRTESSSDRTRQAAATQIGPARSDRSGKGEHDASKGECSPIAVKRKDYFLHVVSTLPGSFGQRAKLDIHRVSPIYEHGWCTHPDDGATHAVILVHGAGTDAVTTFDLQYPKAPDVLHPESDEERARNSKGYEYSLMESLARAGVETFAVNLLGYGFSTRFELDDPCSTSLSEQARLLVPNPLENGVCAHAPDSAHFTNTDAARDQLAVVVNHVLEELDVEKVSFFAWSRGGNSVGAYTSRDPSKVESLVLLASEFELAGNPQPFALLVANRADSFVNWDTQLARDLAGNDRKQELNCPGERDLTMNPETGAPAILDAIWASGRTRDPLGSTWGPSPEKPSGGVRRAPTATLSGWDALAASKIQVPTLIMSGKFDNQNPTARQLRIYNSLASSSRVLIKIDCATHFALWEGSTGSPWKGPHATVHDAAIQWITSKTFTRAEKGIFSVSSAGAVTRDE